MRMSMLGKKEKKPYKLDANDPTLVLIFRDKKKMIAHFPQPRSKK
jgi:hypothetical protein